MENRTYDEALHAMQSGVAAKMARDGSDTSPKQLRVGVNSAMCENAALVRLLIAKGVFTLEEFSAELTQEMEREVERYQKYLDPSGRVKLF